MVSSSSSAGPKAHAEDPSLPLFAFVLLVALGVDYTIFAARVREEAQGKTTRLATTHALGATGSVISSAGLVLAGTFAVLALLQLVTFIEIGSRSRWRRASGLIVSVSCL